MSLTLKRTDFWSNKINAFDSQENMDKINSMGLDFEKVTKILQKVSMSTNLSYLRTIIFLMSFTLILFILPWFYYLIFFPIYTLIFTPSLAYIIFPLLSMSWRNFINLKLIRKRTQLLMNSEKSIDGVAFEVTFLLDLIIHRSSENQKSSEVHEELITNGGLDIVEIFHKPINVCSGIRGQSKIISTADSELLMAKIDAERDVDIFVNNVEGGVVVNIFNPFLWLVVLIFIGMIMTQTLLMLNYNSQFDLPTYAVILIIAFNIVGCPLCIYLQNMLPSKLFKENFDGLMFSLESITNRYSHNGIFLYFKKIYNLLAVVKFNRSITDEDKSSTFFKNLFPQ